MIVCPYYRLPYVQWMLYADGLHPIEDNAYVEREYEDNIFVYTLVNWRDKSNVLVKYTADHWTWQSPVTTCEAEPAEWLYPGYAIDEMTTTSAIISVPTNDYSKPLELLLYPSASCTNVRYWIDSLTGADINKIKIEAFYEGAWHTIYNDTFALDAWEEKTITGGPFDVSRFRVSFHNAGASSENAYLTEFDYKPE